MRVFPVRFFDKGGRKYQAAALGVQQEVEDIRSELVKLLRTLNTTNAGIVGAEHELQKKVGRYRTMCSLVFMARNPHPNQPKEAAGLYSRVKLPGRR